jgi:ribosomal protein S18 acetylase RimI-like enzyme
MSLASKFIIKKLIKDDIDKFARLVHKPRSWRIVLGYDPRQRYTQPWLAETLEDWNFVHYAVNNNSDDSNYGRVIGVCEFQKHNLHTVEVQEEYQRQGVGNAILEQVVQRMDTTVYCFTKNTYMVLLLKKHFRDVQVDSNADISLRNYSYRCTK